MRYLHLGEGHVIYYIVTHLCVKKKEDNDASSFWAKVFFKEVFWAVWWTSTVTTQTPHSAVIQQMCLKLYSISTWMLDGYSHVTKIG